MRSNRGNIESVIDDYAYTQIAALARRAGDVDGVCLVFANSDAGEGYIVVDGNEGDRNNLTLWHNGDTLIQNVTSQCNNTVVVLHTVGAVLVDEWYENPNVTAIIWAGLPGQESGNAIVDILYGKENPGGKTPFTWAAAREDYGTEVLYEPNNGVNAPQDDFTEGIFIDYRHFDRANITPIYEFGFGLSYTTFEYSDIQVQAHPSKPYTSTSGMLHAMSTPSRMYADVSQVVPLEHRSTVPSTTTHRPICTLTTSRGSKLTSTHTSTSPRSLNPAATHSTASTTLSQQVDTTVARSLSFQQEARSRLAVTRLFTTFSSPSLRP